MTETEFSSFPEFDRQQPSPCLHLIRTRVYSPCECHLWNQNLHRDKGQVNPKSTNIKRDVQDNTSHHGATDPVAIDKRGGVCESTVSSTTTAKPRHVAVVTPASPNTPQTVAKN